jgi:tRNA modification GTPase
MYNTLDTIAAIATAPGESPLAIVRLSGPKAKEIIESIFRGAGLENKKASYGRLYGANGEQIDEVVVIFYQKPHGFTAEDLVEIVCHGGHVVPNQVLKILCDKGARLAEPESLRFAPF